MTFTIALNVEQRLGSVTPTGQPDAMLAGIILVWLSARIDIIAELDEKAASIPGYLEDDYKAAILAALTRIELEEEKRKKLANGEPVKRN